MPRYTQRVRNEQFVDAAKNHDVAGGCRVYPLSLEPVETKQLEYAGAPKRVVRRNDANRRIGTQRATADSTNTEEANVGVVVEA